MRKQIMFWPKTTSILKNEEGAVIIAALLVLVLLTIIGIASTNISNTEVRISAHELFHQQNFYRAEGATLQAIDRMEASANPETEDPPLDWMTQTVADSDNLLENDQLFSSDFWENGSDYLEQPEASAFPDTQFIAVAEGVIEGESLDMGSTKIHGYKIVGHSERPNKGSVTIEVGYRKAF